MKAAKWLCWEGVAITLSITLEWVTVLNEKR